MKEGGGGGEGVCDEVEFEWRFYALSASKAVLNIKSYNLIQSGDVDYLMNVTRREPTTGT